MLLALQLVPPSPDDAIHNGVQVLHCCRVAQVVWQGQPFRYGKPCGCPLRKELEGGANGICRQVRTQAVSREIQNAGVQGAPCTGGLNAVLSRGPLRIAPWTSSAVVSVRDADSQRGSFPHTALAGQACLAYSPVICLDSEAGRLLPKRALVVTSRVRALKSA